MPSLPEGPDNPQCLLCAHRSHPCLSFLGPGARRRGAAGPSGVQSSGGAGRAGVQAQRADCCEVIKVPEPSPSLTNGK